MKNSQSIYDNLMNERHFKRAGEIDRQVPEIPGLYCFLIQRSGQLPQPFAQILARRNHEILYIGKASKSLKKRMLNQELRAIGHGTFFRSIGAILGFRPVPGSLKDKKNKNNYSFSEADKKEIINWNNQNLLVNWVTACDLQIEKDLIEKYHPLTNITHNPVALEELKLLRYECRRIARGYSDGK